MKIAYLIEVDPFINSGIVKKINGQITEWRRNGHEVKTFINWPTPRDTGLKPALIGEQYSNKYIDKLPDGFIKNYLSKMVTLISLKKKIRKYQPDILYLRQNIGYPGLPKLLKENNSIMELNSVDFMEMNYNSWLKRRIYFYWKGKVLSNINGLVAVTPDILKHYTQAKVPSITVSNGIDFNKFKVLKSSGNKNVINLVFVGSNNMQWHGLDKVVEMASRFPDWNFLVVGYERHPNGLKCPSNIKYLGWKNKSELEEIYREGAIGIGSFGNYLVGKEIDSTLKVREYLASGLPVIVGHNDVDFLEVDYVFKATNEHNELVENNLISRFVEKYQDYIVSHDEIKFIDTVNKEKQRLKFFKQIAKKET